MNLNSIILPEFVVAELYHSSLIETGETPAKAQPVLIPGEKDPIPDHHEGWSAGWKWLGENRKNILIAVNYKNVVHIPDHELNFLTGILGACKLDLGDVAILNLSNHPSISYKEIADEFKSKIVLLFGMEPTALGLPLNFPHFQVQHFTSSSFLYSPGLNELENDKILKSKLWVCLRRLFNV